MSEQSNADFDITKMGKTEPKLGDGGEENDILAQLVGEGKKFKSLEDLANGKIQADQFIETLKLENKALRESLGSSEESVDELLARVNKKTEPSKGEQETARTGSNQPTPESLTPEKLLDFLDKRDAEKVQKANIDSFNATVKQAFGSKAHEVVSTRLAELGLDSEVFNLQVAKNPASALTLLGIKNNNNVDSGGGALRESSVNTAAVLSGTGSNVENHSYFSKLRRELGHDFYKPEIQQRMIAARKKLGENYWK